MGTQHPSLFLLSSYTELWTSDKQGGFFGRKLIQEWNRYQLFAQFGVVNV